MPTSQEILQGPGSIINPNTTSQPPSSSVFPKPNHSLFPVYNFYYFHSVSPVLRLLVVIAREVSELEATDRVLT